MVNRSCSEWNTVLINPDLRTCSGGGGQLRLLCDEMLKGIGRWLRAAGYDVAMVDNGAHDDDLLARARAERRVLLTCDRRLAARAGDDPAIAVLATVRLADAARELGARLGIDCLHAPFTRCLIDNARLMPANEEHIARLPAAAREGAGPIMRCPRLRPRLLAGQPRAPHAWHARSVAELERAQRP